VLVVLVVVPPVPLEPPVEPAEPPEPPSLPPVPPEFVAGPFEPPSSPLPQAATAPLSKIVLHRNPNLKPCMNPFSVVIGNDFQFQFRQKH